MKLISKNNFHLRSGKSAFCCTSEDIFWVQLLPSRILTLKNKKNKLKPPF